jgi:hypothetical protein
MACVSHGYCLLAQDNSGVVTCLVALAPATRAHDSFGTAMCPVGCGLLK